MEINTTILSHILVFFALQLINVFFSTVKSMILINGKPTTAAIVNAFYYAFYNYLLIMITKENLVVVITVSFFTNLIGVFLGKWIVEKLEKEKLWIYHGLAYCNEDRAKEIKYHFEGINIEVVYSEIKKDEFYEIKLFANTKNESETIVKYFTDNKIKYYIYEAV